MNYIVHVHVGTYMCEHRCMQACVYLLKHPSLVECSKGDGARQGHEAGLQPGKSLARMVFVSLQLSVKRQKKCKETKEI